LVSGNYGRDATYLPDGKGGFTFSPATLAPPSLASVRFSYTASRADGAPAFLAIEDWMTGAGPQLISAGPPAAAADNSFTPFTPMPVSQPVLMLGYSQPFPNAGIDLYCAVTPQPSSAAQATHEPPQLAWEYNDGTEWRRLSVQDETGAMSRSGLISFVAPEDLTTSGSMGTAAAWLRARLIAGQSTPRAQLRAIRNDTMWASQQQSILHEVLGSGNGKPNQSYQTTQQPVLAGQRLEVLEPEAPTAIELAALGPAALRVAQPVTGQSPGVWVTWSEVPDFVASGPRDRHYVIDRVSGMVTFGDGQRGLVPPVARANLQLSYNAGGGRSGNLPAGAITQLRTAIPFISAVTNAEPAQGGADAEDLGTVGVRGPRTLRHRERAVATVDFEDLATEASTSVARTLAIPAAGPPEAGSVGVVIVPASRGARPTPDQQLLAEVTGYLTARMSPTVQLWVSGPGWLQVTVSAALVPVTPEQASEVQSAAQAALAAFLDPLSGGSSDTGWQFGREPHASDFIALLETVPGLDHVAWLGVEQAMVQKAPAPGAFLVTSGQHTITVLSPGPAV
jgi:predicted phage baseplate assembly protein